MSLPPLPRRRYLEMYLNMQIFNMSYGTYSKTYTIFLSQALLRFDSQY